MRKFRVFVAAISDLVCVCLCLGQAGRFSNVHSYFCSNWMMQQVVEKFRVFVAAISGLCACATRRDRSRVKIPHFVAAISGLCVCVCVCMYVLRRAMRQSCENSMLSLRLFPAYVCICLLCFLFGPGRAGFEVLVNCGYFRI